MSEAKQVAVLMGSDSDWDVMEGAVVRLKALGIPSQVRVMSAHRTPQAVVDFVTAAPDNGIAVFIVGAGAAAHLAGVVAAHTTRPVIGVPLASTALNGIDALLSTVQMPAGVPVATVAVGRAGAENAAILAAQMLALGDREVAQRLETMRRDMTAKVAEKNAALQKRLGADGAQS